MKVLTITVSLLTVVSLLFSFAACGKGGNDKKTTTTQDTQSQTADANADLTANQGDETDKESGNTTENYNNTTTRRSETSPVTTTKREVTTTRANTTASVIAPKAKSYNTVSEILDFYKAAANPLKSSSTAEATRTKEVITAISGSIPSMYQTFGFKEGENAEQVKVGSGQKDSMKDRFPVEKQSYVCDLTPDDIESAVCTLKGDVYTVTINVKDDNDGTYNRSKKCVSTINIPIGKWTCKGVQIKATIKDEKLLTLYYNMPTYVTSLTDAFAFTLEQWWTVTSQ